MFSKLLIARWNYGDDEYNCFYSVNAVLYTQFINGCVHLSTLR